MENRSVFSLDGITGMLIATVLLLSILAALTIGAISVQHENASSFYELQDAKNIKMISTENGAHRVMK